MFYDHYQQGFYQEVYNDLLAMQEQVFEETVYPDAIQVIKAIMKRVRTNIEVLIPRLEILGYQFVDGDLNKGQRGSPPQGQAWLDEMFRTFRNPPAETPQLLNVLEQSVGVLPVSLRGWYEEVGSVNLVGTFPATKDHNELTVVLDPLLINSLEFMIEYFAAIPPQEEKTKLPLAPDGALKYGYSGGGPYTVKIPCRAFDANFELDRQSMTFVNYLRICFQWGGFLGYTKQGKMNA